MVYRSRVTKREQVDTLRATLREAGLRATLSRLAVLRQLSASKTPMSHAEVVDRLAGSGFDRATLYRNLIDLAECGLARRTDVGDHVWRFELITGEGGHDQEHPHFVCSNCGNVQCLPVDSVSIHPVRGAPRALRRKGLAIHVRGLCDNCA
jgi:Fur family ferric uptake transcriptional regulator